MKISDALRTHGRGICFLLAAIIALVISLRTIYAPIHPSGDGQGYAIRGFALYGYLHTGQWASFWNLLTRPNQSISPLHYLPFFILPQALAGVACYVLAQNLTTYLLLAAGVFKLSQVLKRTEWAPAILLLCCVNNIGLTDYYNYYLDVEFFSLGLYVVAWQLAAWREKKAMPGILSGLGLGLIFWMKPANALIFFAVFILSELFRAGGGIFADKSIAERRERILDSLRRWGWQALGSVPLLGAALVCGGGQTILQLIHNNEINDAGTPLDCEIVVRLFYFPLCLSYFYHVLVLGGLLLVALFIGRKEATSTTREGGEFARQLFVPLALAFLVWGEFFSFWIQAKSMRSLLPMLPLFWIALCWLAERRRLRVDLLFLVAAIYACVAFSQKAFDLLGTRSSYVDDTYQLTLDSWIQMPSRWLHGITVNTAIGNGLSQHPPPPGIICVNSIELQKDIAWRLCGPDLLQGKPPRYDVRIIFNFKGDYLDKSFIGANLIIFKSLLGAQAESVVDAESMSMLQYGISEWVTNRHWAQPGVFGNQGEDPIGYLFLFPRALTQEQVEMFNKSEPFADMVHEDNDGSVPITGPHYTRAEAWQLLKAWYEKRTGMGVGK